MKLYVEELVVTRNETNFDKACDSAYALALMRYGINEDGNGTKKDIEIIRSRDSVHVKFVGYTHEGSMVGHNYTYIFESWVERFEEDEDDDI